MTSHPAKTCPRVLETFQAQVEGRLRLGEDIPVLRKDGSTFRADISTQTTRYNGRSSLIGIFRDVTERNRMERVLRPARKSIALILTTRPLASSLLMQQDDTLRSIRVPLGLQDTPERNSQNVDP